MSFTDERLIRIYASLQTIHHFTDEQIEKLGLFAEQASLVVGESPTSIMEKINNQLIFQAVQEQPEALSAKYLHPRIYDTLDGYHPMRKKHGKSDAQRKKETAKRHKRNKNKKTHRK